jgi:succinoglycan biosynthesis protein ExoM
MNTIAICIPTYRRPLLLSKLITGILESSTDPSIIKCVKIIIVDNDALRSAEKSVSELQTKNRSGVSIEYHCFPAKGLSNVRNELLKKAFLVNPHYIVFVDDDEHVSVEWLNELVKTIIQNKADLVMGPVISLFDSYVPESISCWFDRPLYPDNNSITAIATNNLIINASTLMTSGVWFDMKFNTIGAEDSYFGLQLLKYGARGFWSSNAIVYETVPDSRANLNWLMRRYYNGANTYTYILKLEKEYRELSKKLLASLFYVICGLLALVLVPLPLRKKYWGPLKISEGVGAIAGSLNMKYNEYK